MSGELVGRARGLARSLVPSYAAFWRRRRMTAFYGQFVGPGDLAFDVGSHVGTRLRAFRTLGTRVVAVEPQPDLVAVLRRLYGRDPLVTVETCAVGARTGTATLQIATRTPTVSTVAPSWIDEVRSDPRFTAVRWDQELTVPLTTLDSLVERHGEPRFCKIDVEGSELDVLLGLSRPLPALSFEYLAVVSHRAAACVERLAELGSYRFTYSPLETLRWATDRWLDAEEIVAELRALPRSAPPGDVYAVRADTARL
ncbi:FkbM family methyltransferase [Georgenia sp. SUBG003]|uniref:FkbM family methyltransferase n=1 Tax=Georgenia sp. SUBG003 TaxID=1497974 RepID=UPI0004D79E9A|nr:methyltransferase [Georgenia sp. SUBG003]